MPATQDPNFNPTVTFDVTTTASAQVNMYVKGFHEGVTQNPPPSKMLTVRVCNNEVVSADPTDAIVSFAVGATSQTLNL